MLQLKRSGCCHCWWLLWFGLVVVVPISVDFFFISFQFGLHITNFSLKFRPVQLCCSRRRAAAAHRVSRRSDTNQPNTANYATQHLAVGTVMLMAWDPFVTQTRRVLTQRLWDLVWISDWNECKAEWYMKSEVPVVSHNIWDLWDAYCPIKKLYIT